MAVVGAFFSIYFIYFFLLAPGASTETFFTAPTTTPLLCLAPGAPGSCRPSEHVCTQRHQNARVVEEEEGMKEEEEEEEEEGEIKERRREIGTEEEEEKEEEVGEEGGEKPPRDEVCVYRQSGQAGRQAQQGRQTVDLKAV